MPPDNQTVRRFNHNLDYNFTAIFKNGSNFFHFLVFFNLSKYLLIEKGKKP